MQGTRVQVAMIRETNARTNISMSAKLTKFTHTHTPTRTHTNSYSLTDNFDKAILGFGCHRVDLAHIPSHVLLLHIVNVQKPGAMLVVLIVRYANPRIARYHMIMHRQNGRLLKVHPRHLQQRQKQKHSQVM